GRRAAGLHPGGRYLGLVARGQLEQAVESPRALGHRHVAAAVEDREARPADASRELVGIGRRNDVVLTSSRDQTGYLDLLEAIEDVVARKARERLGERLRPLAALEELPYELRAQD